MTSRSVVFAEPVRTAIGTFGGSLKDVPAPTLGAVAIGAAVARAGIRPDEVETVVMGNVVQAGDKMNPARQAGVHAGLPVTTPAMTVNRVCGSGAQAIVSAAQEILLGNIDVRGRRRHGEHGPGAVSHRPRPLGLSHGRRPALRQHAARRLERRFLRPAFRLAYRGPGREVSGHARGAGPLGAALAAALRRRAGRRSFQVEIVPVEVPGKKGPTPFDKDEHNRPDTTLETLAKLKPAFRPDGTITAGNAPGLNDAAAAMVLADAAWAEKRGLAPHGAPCVLRHRGGRARHVRPRAGARGPAGAGARRLGRWLGRARRDQRGLRGHRHRRRPASSGFPKTSSMSRAAPSRTAIRSAPPARS